MRGGRNRRPQAAQPQGSAFRSRRLLRQTLDRLGLEAKADDLHAHLAHRLDRELRLRNAAFVAADAPDGLPLPPPELVYLVGGHFDLVEYFESGRTHAQLIQSLLTQHGRDLASTEALLDFGCGCGRVLRHLHPFEIPQLHGTDYNPRLIEWCTRAFRFAHFTRNGLMDSLSFSESSFDAIYAISVFTHLTERLQEFWIGELSRVLRPGGVLLATTKGASRLDPLDKRERERFDAGELVMKYRRYAGQNLCAAFHPERYVRERLAPRLQLLAFVQAGSFPDQSQDVALFERPLTP